MKTYYVQIEQLRTDEYLKIANRNFVEPVILKNEVISELKKILPKAPKMDGLSSFSYEQKCIYFLIQRLEDEDCAPETNPNERG